MWFSNIIKRGSIVMIRGTQKMATVNRVFTKDKRKFALIDKCGYLRHSHPGIVASCVPIELSKLIKV